MWWWVVGRGEGGAGGAGQDFSSGINNEVSISPIARQPLRDRGPVIPLPPAWRVYRCMLGGRSEAEGESAREYNACGGWCAFVSLRLKQTETAHAVTCV